MRNCLFALTLFSSLFTSTASAVEQINMRPGLWEVTTSSDLLWLVPQIPPDQMQNIKDLAKDYGFDMPAIQNGAAVSKVCITQEMANQKNPPVFYQNQFGCTTKNSTRIGNNYKMDFVCTSAELNGNGIAEGSITNADNFTGKTRFSGTAQGNPVNEQADVSGKWVNASCGAVKPLQ